MKITLAALLLSGFIMSCKSEYNERFQQAQILKQKLQRVLQTHNELQNDVLVTEIETIQSEITFLAKVSGNEELFMEELEKD